MKTRKLVTVAAAVGALFSAGQTYAAFTFDTSGETLTTLYSTSFEGADLSATVAYTLTSFVDSDTATFSVFVNNTTDPGEPGTNRLVGFAVDSITPELQSVEDFSSIFNTSANTNFPGGIQNVDFCAISGSGNNCSGGASGGLTEGQNTTFTVTMNFASAHGDSITFAEPYAVRYQSAGSTSDSIVFTGCEAGPNCPPDNGGGPPVLIPEPSTLALLGLGLLGAGFARRRRSSKTV